MEKIAFFKESLKNLKTVGTVVRSSKFVCKEMVSHVDFSKAKYIVELGAGDGVITKHILDKMSKDSILLSFEVNKKFCDQLRQINDPRLRIIEDSAENVEIYLKKENIKKIDAIISAIPFVSLPNDLGYSIVGECKKHLKKEGPFIQIHYSLLAKKIYKNVFGNVDINFVPLNLPPAFVLVSKNRA